MLFNFQNLFDLDKFWDEIVLNICCNIVKYNLKLYKIYSKNSIKIW